MASQFAVTNFSSTFSKPLATLVALITLLLMASGANASSNYPLPDVPHIVVEGRGEVKAVPDIITIEFEINRTAKTLAEAKTQVDQLAAKAIAAAKKHAVKAEDIQASKIQASPKYEYRAQQRVYVGEQVKRQFAVTLRKPKHYNALVDGLLSNGVSRFQSIKTDFSQREVLEKQALGLAIKNAKQQAEAISEFSQASIHSIYQVVAIETGGPVYARMEMSAMADNKRTSAPLELGLQPIEKRVRVVYQLKTL